MKYLIGFTLSFTIALALTPLVRRLAFKIKAVDRPIPNSRKIHTKVMARAGGIVLWASFVISSLIMVDNQSQAFWGLLLAVTIVMIVGLIDDIYRLNPWVKLLVQAIAAAVAIGMGIKITSLSNLSGGFVSFDSSNSFVLGGLSLSASVVSVAISMLWLVGMTNTVNFLDGLDGLATGVAAIAALVMFILSVGPRVDQPQTAMLAIILAGACIGYLIYNFYPASIFNGDSGAYFLGMCLAILAIISGAKLATAFLVLGLPILDAGWAVLRRIITGRSPFSADRGHIHFLLLDVGLSQRQAILIIYSFSICFGIVALLSQTVEKLIALGVLLVITAILLTYLHTQHAISHPKRKQQRKAN